MDPSFPPQRQPGSAEDDELSATELFDLALTEIDRHQRKPWRPVCLHCTRTGCAYLERARDFVATVRLLAAERNARPEVS